MQVVVVFKFCLRLLPEPLCQMTRNSAWLVTSAGALMGGSPMWLGASHTGSVTTAGWTWVDGTNASNLNSCQNCTIWQTGEPKWVGNFRPGPSLESQTRTQPASEQLLKSARAPTSLRVDFESRNSSSSCAAAVLVANLNTADLER